MPNRIQKVQFEFCDSIIKFENAVKSFQESITLLESAVLTSFRKSSMETCAIFAKAQADLGSEECWRLKYLLLDVIYGEPTTLILHSLHDLSDEHGELHFLRPWSEIGHPLEVSTSRDCCHRLSSTIERYGRSIFQPHYKSCLRLWNSLETADMALLSEEVRRALAIIVDQLHEINATFQRIEMFAQEMDRKASSPFFWASRRPSSITAERAGGGAS